MSPIPRGISENIKCICCTLVALTMSLLIPQKSLQAQCRIFKTTRLGLPMGVLHPSLTHNMSLVPQWYPEHPSEWHGAPQSHCRAHPVEAFMFSSCLMGSCQLWHPCGGFGRGWRVTTLIHCDLGSLHREERLPTPAVERDHPGTFI